MQNSWRFVDDEVLRDRLKEAKGIGTPATRAEIIGGLKRQDFLVTQGKNIVPTELGLKLFGVLEQADPALVDPGVTAQLECLLDDVVVGKQEMMGAIDAVCDAAPHHRQADPRAGGGWSRCSVLQVGQRRRPPTPAMKRSPSPSPPEAVRCRRLRHWMHCRAFLEQHAPGSGGETAAERSSGDLGASIGRREQSACSETAPQQGRDGSSSCAQESSTRQDNAKAQVQWPDGQRLTWPFPARRRRKHAVENSLRQQGNRSETRGPLRHRRLVCASWR